MSIKIHQSKDRSEKFQKIMEVQKSITGKIFLSRKSIFKAGAYFSISIAVVIAAMIAKFLLSSKLNYTRPIFSYIMMSVGVALLFMAYFFYIVTSRRTLIAEPKNLYALATAMVMTFIANIALAELSILAMPVTLTAFIVAPLAKRIDAFVSNLFINCLIFYTLFLETWHGGNDEIFETIVMFMVGVISGSVTALMVSSSAKRFNYIVRGFIIGTLSYTAILLANLTVVTTTLSFTEVIGYSAIGIYIPLLVGILVQPLFEIVFNLVTNARLVEFIDHNSPLIKRLRTETPGTFNHCLAVASFAEMCALAIGENPYLARACAYYHDIGKLNNAEYFKENQDDINPHDELLPEVSADIIRAHTTDGLKLCEQYRIPQEISHVTIQHHGTLLIPVFYNKAKQLTDGIVNTEEYRYRGVTPVTKIAAIIMLCDVAEAAIRAMDAPNAKKVDELLTSLIQDRIVAGQFNNCDISLRDLDAIKNAIINAYGGLFHKRMQYPNGDKARTNKNA